MCPTLVPVGSNPGTDAQRWSVLLGVRTMKAYKQFSIRLANGREETFDNASAMVEWMNRQRGLEPRQSKSIYATRSSSASTQTYQHKRSSFGTVRESAQRRSLNLRVCGFDSRPCYWKGTWRNNTARSSIGRTPVSHAGKMSSILIRVTEQR